MSQIPSQHYSSLGDNRLALILNLDRHLAKEQARQWVKFYWELHEGYPGVLFDAYCPSVIRRGQGRVQFGEHWRPLAVYALCPQGMKEEKRLLVPLALEKWKVVFQLEDVCWQETSCD